MSILDISNSRRFDWQPYPNKTCDRRDDGIVAILRTMAAGEAEAEDATSSAICDVSFDDLLDGADAFSFEATSTGHALEARASSGYAGNGQWSVQVGEALLDGEGSRLFINIVDPFGGIALQLHGMQTDRTFGDVIARGGDMDCQLRVYAFLGDFFGDVERVLYPLTPVGGELAIRSLLDDLAGTADWLSDANIDFCPRPVSAQGIKVQDGNSVIAALVAVIGHHVEGFGIAETLGWLQPEGLAVNPLELIQRPFGNEIAEAGLPKAPAGRIAPFSRRDLDRWLISAEKRSYAATVPATSLFPSLNG